MTEPPDPGGPGGWQFARVVALADETARARTITLELPRPSPHRPGQHYVVRLTAPDGYTASRSYSAASAPDGTARIDLTVERLPDGEASTFLHDVVEVGDELEVRGPIGGWFVWEGISPALLVGAGSGVVPLMAMLRHARRTARTELVRLLVSVRSPADLYYREELPGPETTVVYTRESPPGWPRPPGRITATDLRALTDHAGDATTYVCGSPAFCDAATDLLATVGVSPARIRVERFGPSG